MTNTTTYCELCCKISTFPFEYCRNHLSDKNTITCGLVTCDNGIAFQKMVCQKHYDIWQQLKNRSGLAKASCILAAHAIIVLTLRNTSRTF